MISDYDRLVELVNSAGNSSGANQEQFEKTLDSYATKVQQLKNAWNEFSMGIMNSDLVKTGIDILTKLLQVINKATEGLGKTAEETGESTKNILNSITGMISKIGVIIAAFTVGKKIFEVLKPKVEVLFQNLGSKAGKAFGEAANAEISKTIQQATEAAKATGANGQNAGGAPNTDSTQNTGGATGANERNAGSPTSETSENNAKGLRQEGNEAKTTRKWYQKLMKTEKQLNEMSKRDWYDGIANAASTAGMAIAGLGVSISAVGTALEELGYSGAAEVFQTIGQVATTAGSTIMGVGTAMKGVEAIAGVLHISLGKVWLIILAIAAAVAALAIVIKSIYDNSPAGKLEALKEAAEEAKDAANDATEAYKNLDDGLTSLGDKYEALKTLTRGTKDWNSAVIEINEQVLELIDKYEELEDYAYWENGVLTINLNSDAVQQVLKNYQKDWYSKQAASQQADFEEDRQEAENSGEEILTESQQKLKEEEEQRRTTAVGQLKQLELYSSKDEKTQFQLDAFVENWAAGRFQKGDYYFDEETGRIMANKNSDNYFVASQYFQGVSSPFSTLSEEEQRELYHLVAGYEKGYVNTKYSDSALETLLSGGLSLSDASDENKDILSNVIDNDIIAQLYDSNSKNGVGTMNNIGELAGSAGSFVSSLKKTANLDYYPQDIWDGIIKDEGLGLTSNQLGVFQKIIDTNPKALKKYFDAMPEEWKSKIFSNDLGNFTNWVIARTKKAEFAFEGSENTLGGNLSGATAGAQQGIANLLTNVFGEDSNKIKEQASAIRNQGNNLSADEQTEFYSYLGSLYNADNKSPVARQNWLAVIDEVANSLGAESAKVVQELLDASDVNYDSSFLSETMGLGKNLISAYEKANDKAVWNKTLDSWYADYKTANDVQAKSYYELVEQALEALQSEIEKQTETLEDLADDYSEANEKILDGIRGVIEENRQARENDKTESDLNDKRNQLVYLSADTSGARALDVLNLEKEIDEAEQDYQDSLIDQALDKLEDANAKAEEQRQTQIDLLNEIAEAAPESLLKEAKSLVDKAIAAVGNGIDIKDTELGQLLGGQQSFLAEYDKGTFWTNLNNTVSYAVKGTIEDGETTTTTINERGVGLLGGAQYRNNKTETLYGYATGGLADFTGPAWLDGSRAKPELVLNAQDTQNFIALKDILSKAFKDPSQVSNTNGGDNHFDIDINVEKIEDNYDVEQMAEAVRKLIYNDATYRNVNAVGIVR